MEHEKRQKEYLSLLRRFVRSTDQLANHFAKVDEPKRFYRRKSFWSALIFFSGFVGLFISWQEQIDMMKVDNLKQDIERIYKFKQQVNLTVSKARMTIINQNLSCPVKDKEKLVAMKVTRNNTLIPIVSLSGGIRFEDNKAIWKNVDQIVSAIYNLKPKEICQIDIYKFDNKLLLLSKNIVHIANKNLGQKQQQIRKIEQGIF